VADPPGSNTSKVLRFGLQPCSQGQSFIPENSNVSAGVQIFRFGLKRICWSPNLQIWTPALFPRTTLYTGKFMLQNLSICFENERSEIPETVSILMALQRVWGYFRGGLINLRNPCHLCQSAVQTIHILDVVKHVDHHSNHA
jgi:hypothetical protein